jgi:uncharacterized RDD family membrane protein YckC
MKCPKCGYLGFESGDRCRNCGYEFSLTTDPAPSFDLLLDPSRQAEGRDTPRPPLDLDRLIGAPEDVPVPDLPLFEKGMAGRAVADHPVSETQVSETIPRVRRVDEGAPLINAARPRAPLGVRRATPEIPRARIKTPRSIDSSLFETPSSIDPRDRSTPAASESLASPVSRVIAGLLDIALLTSLDALVLYFTLRLLGLSSSEIFELPAVPLAAFFLLLNGGYFTAFTAVGGQSIGKMACGIKVIGQEDGSVPVGRATLRTLAYLVSALPLGAGFLPGLFSGDRLALHDRLAHTRVVRPTST